MKSQVFSESFRNRAIGFCAVLGFLNSGAWIWAILAFHDRPILLGTALLAYTFGIRHAVDADHIAAIDNVTRKLVQEGQRPASVGFFFALGHSTIVVIAALIIYASVSRLGKQLDVIREAGSIAGTWASVFFLISIAMINLVILRGVWKTFRKVREGEDYSGRSPDLLLGGGIFSRMFRPLFRLLRSPCHMYPVGLLFGLGFDTATEVALLGMSAGAAVKGLPLESMAVFPFLFMAGMTLIDTLDGILMVGAYGWAFIKPIRKLYYNLAITSVSVGVALFIGGLEAVGLLKDRLNLRGWGWALVGSLNDNFASLGFVLVGVFALSWIASAIIYRVKGSRST